MSVRNRDLWVLGGLWVVLSLVGEGLAGLVLERWPTALTAQGQISAAAFALLLRVGIVVFVLVALLIVYSAIRFRAPEGDVSPVDAPVQRRGGRAFTLGWLAITTALNVLFIVNPGVVGLSELARLEREAQDEGPLVVEVTARQWAWRYRYPAYGIEDATELALPVGKPVELRLTSPDVIHSFWVPAFGIKRDVIPGQTTILYLTPTAIGSTEVDPRVRVQCAELCGAGHAEMRSTVRVLSATDFAAWVAAQAAPGETMPPMPGMSMAPGETMSP